MVCTNKVIRFRERVIHLLLLRLFCFKNKVEIRFLTNWFISIYFIFINNAKQTIFTLSRFNRAFFLNLFFPFFSKQNNLSSIKIISLLSRLNKEIFYNLISTLFLKQNNLSSKQIHPVFLTLLPYYQTNTLFRISVNHYKTI